MNDQEAKSGDKGRKRKNSPSSDSSDIDAQIESVLNDIKCRDPHETEFIQAVTEVAMSLKPLFRKYPMYLKTFRVLAEPERVVQFRVSWFDDAGNLQTNRGYRVQFNSAIGIYKGGLRFHPNVNLSVLKFLSFEQVLKNSLTSLRMGGAKGGADFDPHGKSDREVMMFCQSFMTELARHIGPSTDIPAGDIGVGPREIGYMYGHYRRIVNRFEGVLTGKALEWGGSFLRPEATGYGVVYITKHLLTDKKMELKGMKCLVSGSGNVAQHCATKLVNEGAILLAMSDSSGYVMEPEGFTAEQLDHIKKLKNEKRGRIKEYVKFSKTAKYKAGAKVWEIPAQIAIPCATQNEIDEGDAKTLVKNGVKLVVEGANMPSTNQAIDVYKENNVWFIPAKAANAGGVAVSGLELSQDGQRISWSREKVKRELESIMRTIYEEITRVAEELGEKGNLQLGANAAAFLKIAKAMQDQGDVVLPKE